MRKSIHIGRLWATVLGVAALLSMSALAPAVAAQDGPTEQQIFAELQVDQVASDYVVLVDTSGSMAADGLYDNVRTTLRPFLAGLTSADHLAIYTFDDVVRQRYLGPAGATDGILNLLPNAPTPEGHTDIGAALRIALDELGRSGAADVASIVLLTDGKNEPLDGSEYSDTNGPAWTALTVRATELSQAHKSFRGYALPLRENADGAQLLRQVVSNTLVIEPRGLPDIVGFLDQTKHATRVEKAKQQLVDDIGKGVVVEWPAERTVDMNTGAAELNLTLRSQLTHVPLTLTNLHIDVKDAAATVAQLQQQPPPQLALQPGGTTQLTVRLRWQPGAGPLPILRTTSLEPVIAVRADVSSPWTAALASDIPLNVATEPVDGTRTIRYEATVGWWGTLPLTIVTMLAAAIAIIVFFYRRRHPELTGELRAKRPFHEGELRIPLRGRTTELSLLTQNGPHGLGAVRARRNGSGKGGIILEITYSPDGSAGRESTELCPLGESVMIGGVRFSHVVEPAAARESSSAQR